MRTTIAIAAALALTSTAALADPGERTFVHQGNTYTYVTQDDHGRTVLTGRQMPSGNRFRLVVDGKRVTGTSGGQPVSFRTSTARGAAGRTAGGVQTAAN